MQLVRFDSAPGVAVVCVLHCGEEKGERKEKQLIMLQRELIEETKYLIAVFRVPALAIKRQSIYRHTATEDRLALDGSLIVFN